MTVVTGNCELVREQTTVARFHEQLRRRVRAGRRASELACQLTAYAGKGAVMFAQINVNDVIRENAASLEAGVSGAQKLDFQLADELPAVEADSSQIHQVVANLVINGAEAIGEGSGVITIRTGVASVQPDQLDIVGDMCAGEHVYVEVGDTGPAIPPEVKAGIFDPFFSTKFLGRGLGLAAVAGIARCHHGGVSVHSVPGCGSAFTVFFPISKSYEASSQRAKTADSAAEDGAY